MGCHSQIRVDTPQLAAVRASFDTGQPIEWNRVHNLPDYAYFNHSAHVNNGVGCSSCHGPVDRMEGMWKTETMTMGWCLDCHRQPETQVRPLNEVFNMSYKAPKDQLALGTELVASYHINTDKLPQCSTCHR
jgi:formate-dependent nitrite reductase cytochrome c552 subunit